MSGMADFLEFLLGLLNVGDLVTRTGEWALSLFGWRIRRGAVGLGR
jgi:hypothetical protein